MDIITIIVLTGITNLTFGLYSWQQVRNPESHVACKDWAQAHLIKAISFIVYTAALVQASDELRWTANILILLGCWLEVRAYNRLANAGMKPLFLLVGFFVTTVVFSYMHFTSSAGPNNTMIVTASFLIALPLSLNVFALSKLSQQNPQSLFPKVLLAVNVAITTLLLIRGALAVNNPEYTITQALFSNQLFIFATFISALGNGIGFLGFLKEQSDQKLENRANIDFLTGIHNRQYFEKLTRDRLMEDAPLTLYFIDIDKFKSVNDRFGHATGDVILKCFARLLLTQQAQYDGVAGRLGGEEFGLVLPTSTAIRHETIINKLRTDFAAESEQAIGEALTFSIGACSSTQANTVHELMRAADVLLYDAKRTL